MSEHIQCECDVESHIGRIVIQRPEQANAFSMDMVAAFRAALTQLESNDAIKVIVISATGGNLTRGFDPAEVEQIYKTAPGGSSRKVPSQRARVLALDALWWGPHGLYGRLLHCPKITILAAKGLCHEVGLYLALYCDERNEKARDFYRRQGFFEPPLPPEGYGERLMLYDLAS